MALPAAVVLALGAGLSTEVRAQSTFDGTQATTFTLTTPTNTSPFTFGANANIGPTAAGTDAVDGDTLTNWVVFNKGQLSGGASGIVLGTPGGNSVINSGSITGLSGNGVLLGANSNVTNLAGGTITGSVLAVRLGLNGTVTNAGTMVGRVTVQGGSVITNQSGGTITGDASVANGNGTVSNAGAIGGEVLLGDTGSLLNQNGATIGGGVRFGFIAGVSAGSGSTAINAGSIGGGGIAFANGGSVTNLTGGTITGGIIAGVFTDGLLSVINQAGGTITGIDGVHSFSSGTLTNAGAITGTTGNGIAFQQGGSVTNLAGGTITGGSNGINLGGAATNVVTNAGTITGQSAAGVSINAINVSVTNLAGGTITGAIGLDIADTTATVINAGTITGTSGTAIRLTGRDTVILQTGSTINGDVVGAVGNFVDRLVLQGAGTANNQFLNFVFLDVQASGAWALNGVLDFLAGTAVRSGTLVVGDASHPGAQLSNGANSVIINAGATLAGQGTVIGDVFAAGGATIAPGAASPFSTLNVTGNAQFNTGSLFNINVNGAGQTDRLAVTGTGTLVGGTVQVLAQPGNYAAQTNYTILTAGTRNSTVFAGVTANSIFLAPSLSYPSQQQVVLTLASRPFNSAAQTPNQTSVANALNAGAQNTLTALLFGQTSIAGAQQIFDALSGEVFASVKNTQAEETQFARNAMLGRMRQADADGDTAALSFGGPMAFAESLYNNLPAPIASANASANGRTASSSRELTSWLQGYGGYGKADGNGNAAALNTTYSGFLTGADVRYGMLRVGLMGGYSHAKLNVDARGSSGTIDSAQLGAYGSMSVAGFHLRSGASASFSTIDTSRTVAFPGFADRTRGRFNGTTAQVFGEVAYSVAIDKVAIEPFAGLAYVHIHDAAFTETGGLAALSAAAGNMGIGYSSLGLRAGTLWTLANGTVIAPHASAAWQHAFGDVVPTAALAFASTGAAFTVTGVPIAQNAALIEGGIDWRITAQMTFGVAYQGELATNARTNTAKGNFTWNF